MKFKGKEAFAVLALGAVIAPGRLALAAPKPAPKPPPPPPIAAPPLKAEPFSGFSKTLDLTEEQQSKIKVIMDNETKQLKALQENPAFSREERFDKWNDTHLAAVKQVREVLKPEQQKKFDDILEKARQKVKDRTKPPTPSAPTSTSGTPNTPIPSGG